MGKDEKLTSTKEMEQHVDPKLAAIKEIIFGENIKEYDKEFKAIHDMMEKQEQNLQSKIDGVKADLEKLIDGMQTNLSDQLSSLKEETNNKIQSLSQEKSDEKNALAEMLIEMGNKIKSTK